MHASHATVLAAFLLATSSRDAAAQANLGVYHGWWVVQEHLSSRSRIFLQKSERQKTNPETESHLNQHQVAPG